MGVLHCLLHHASFQPSLPPWSPRATPAAPCPCPGGGAHPHTTLLQPSLEPSPQVKKALLARLHWKRSLQREVWHLVRTVGFLIMLPLAGYSQIKMDFHWLQALCREMPAATIFKWHYDLKLQLQDTRGVTFPACRLLLHWFSSGLIILPTDQLALPPSIGWNLFITTCRGAPP